MERSDKRRVIRLVSAICDMYKDSFMASFFDYSKDLRHILNSSSSNAEKTRQLFQPLMASFSYQGVSDRIADLYRNQHGDVTYLQISRRINEAKEESGKVCSRLQNFESFTGCGYKKGKQSCKNPRMLRRCPLPSHELRNGILNRKAYSFYFFLRDECKGDLIQHINEILGSHLEASPTGDFDIDSIDKARSGLVSEFKKIHGVKNKLANMALSDLLLANGRNKKWVAVGYSMVAIDSLVHNFFHRTGSLKAFGSEHKYGSGSCDESCRAIIYSIAKEIDASVLNKKHPKYFPRFVQGSIWAYCAENGLNVCNGRNIDDRKPCSMGEACRVSDLCAKIPLSHLK